MEVALRYTLLILFTLFTLFILFKLLKQLHVCLYMLFGKVRMVLEWADSELLSKMVSERTGWITLTLILL